MWLPGDCQQTGTMKYNLNTDTKALHWGYPYIAYNQSK